MRVEFDLMRYHIICLFVRAFAYYFERFEAEFVTEAVAGITELALKMRMVIA